MLRNSTAVLIPVLAGRIDASYRERRSAGAGAYRATVDLFKQRQHESRAHQRFSQNGTLTNTAMLQLG